jgi:hypothetical protein
METFIPCICQALALTFEELIKIRVAIHDNDPDVLDECIKMLENINKYPKKDRKKIIDTMLALLKQLKLNSVQNSNANLNEALNPL